MAEGDTTKIQLAIVQDAIARHGSSIDDIKERTACHSTMIAELRINNTNIVSIVNTLKADQKEINEKISSFIEKHEGAVLKIILSMAGLLATFTTIILAIEKFTNGK
jgi:FtsZ-binding cell division protein ZapB